MNETSHLAIENHHHGHGNGHSHGEENNSGIKRNKSSSFHEKIIRFFIDPKYCMNNQLPRFYANIIVISIIFSGAYIDSVYYSFHIKNKFDRKYEVVWMMIMFVWATLVYLKCSHVISSQTKIEDYVYSKEDDVIMGKPIVNVKHNKFSNYCEFCKGKKFERTSHCKQCGFCVLRRDHHCPGLGVCVGYHNTQLFCNLTFIMIVSFIFIL